MKNAKKIVALTVIGLCLGDAFIPNLLKVYGTESDQPAESNVLPIQDIVEENGGANDLVESNEPNPAPPSESIDSSNLIEDVDVIEEAKKEPITEAPTETEVTNSATPIEEKLPVTTGVKASGTFGTSSWIFDSEGTLTFFAGEFSKGSLELLLPGEQIKKIIFAEKVFANVDSSSLFSNLSQLSSIENITNFDTSQVTEMSYMFENCSSLIDLDVTHFDTSKVTDMHAMFDGCKSLTNLDLSKFDTSNLRSTLWMFASCTNLSSLDLSNFNTQNVEEVYGMFFDCQKLQIIKLGSFSKLNGSVLISDNDTKLPDISKSTVFTGRWIDTSFTSIYPNSRTFTDKYDGSFPGTYIWERVETIVADNSSMYVGDKWNAEDNFVSATDKAGNPVVFDPAMVSGTVDTTKIGEYPITYTNGAVKKEILVTVKENKTSIDAKNSSMYVGDKWNEEDNFVSATDKAGNPVAFDPSMVSGSVDTTKAGEYPITYTNGAVKKEIIVTVKENKISIDAKNSSMYVGDKWNAEDNFVSATDKAGNPVVFDPAMVSGTVDTTKIGEYPITYTNGAVKKEILVTVKENKTSIDAKNSSMYVGDKWNAEDNFVSATDKAGNPDVFDPAMVSGTVDTTKIGEYPITYTNGTVKKEILVTVKENKTSIDAKNSSMYVGDKWNAEDNFVSATDKAGNPVVFDPAMVSGTVDTTKIGEYPITYTNGAVKKEILVTVKENKTSIDAKNSSMYVGDKWNEEDNFVSATDKAGNPVAFDPSMVSGSVDTTKAGEYPITYTNGAVKKEIIVTVKENKISIDAKNSSMYVGDKWNAEDNFVSATDKAGNPVVFDPAMVSGTVDTTKIGEYPITYTNGAVKKEILVTVKENKTSIDAKNSSMYVGDKWNAEDNFVSATDKAGNPDVFDPAMVSGTVDTTKIGEYPITYTNGTVKKEILVTVKENKTSIDAKNSSMYVGDKWNAEDNFVSATDKAGNPVVFDPAMVSGTVDTTKIGEYPITYTNGAVKKEILVTVNENKTDKQIDSVNDNGKKDNEAKNNLIFPQTGEVTSSNILGLSLLFLGMFVIFKRKKKLKSMKFD